MSHNFEKNIYYLFILTILRIEFAYQTNSTTTKWLRINDVLLMLTVAFAVLQWHFHQRTIFHMTSLVTACLTY